MKGNIHKLFQIINHSLVTRAFIPFLFFLFSFKPGEGLGGRRAPVIQKEVKVEGTFQRVCIKGDISMVLTNEPAGTLMMEGNEKDVNKVKYILKNNELTIDAQKKNRFDELTIYLSAATLKSMLVNGDADISSTGTIHTDLQIWLNGNVNVEVKTTGKISVDAYDGYDLFWKSPALPGRK